MAQGLQLSQRLTQSLVLAPQLQQSLALLQAPTLELKALVEQELQQNPVLEEAAASELDQQDKESSDAAAAEAADPAEPPADLTFDPASEKPSTEPVDDFQAEFDRLVQLDQEWRDHFAQSSFPTRNSTEDEEKRQFMFDSLVAGTSLQEVLLEQVRESALEKDLWPVAEMLIGNIDEYGYLKATVDELAASTGLAPEKIMEVLKAVQSFDPSGVGARDLRECLMLQLERSIKRTPSNTGSLMNSWRRSASDAFLKSPGAQAPRWMKCRMRLRTSRDWNRALAAHTWPTTTNIFCPRCSCIALAMISWFLPTTSTFPTCASAMPTKI